MPCNVCGERKGAAESQAYAFEELIVFLIRGYLHLVVIPLQYLPCDRQDGRDKLIPCLYTMSVNVIFAVNGDNVLFIIEEMNEAMNDWLNYWNNISGTPDVYTEGNQENWNYNWRDIFDQLGIIHP